MLRDIKLIAVLLGAAIVVSGCGGGSSESTTAAAAAAAAPSGITGTVSTGAPAIGASVVMICAGGTAGTTRTTDATGTYTLLSGTGGTAPCVIRASGGNILSTAGESGVMISIVQSGQTTAHVNQLTHLLAHLVAGGNPVTLLFNAPSAISGLVTAAKVASNILLIQTNVLASFVGVISGFSSATFDFLTGSFSLNGAGFDAILDNIVFSATSASAPLITLRTGVTVAQFSISSTGTVALSGTAATSGTVSSGIVNLAGLQAFADLLKTRLWGNTTTFSVIGLQAFSDVIDTNSSLLSSQSSVLFELVSSANSASGARVKTSLATLGTLTAQLPTLVALIANSVTALNVKLNYTNAAGTLTAVPADVNRTVSGTTAAAWRLNRVTP